MRLRVNKGTLLAACVGGQNSEHFIYDVSLSPQLVDRNKITLNEHECEGFGLDWHPAKQNYLATGAFDKKACVWDVAGKSSNSIKPIKVFEHGAGVEDVKWFRKDENLLATAAQDKTVNM